jgi:hypothetical protein
VARKRRTHWEIGMEKALLKEINKKAAGIGFSMGFLLSKYGISRSLYYNILNDFYRGRRETKELLEKKLFGLLDYLRDVEHLEKKYMGVV